MYKLNWILRIVLIFNLHISFWIRCLYAQLNILQDDGGGPCTKFKIGDDDLQAYDFIRQFRLDLLETQYPGVTRIRGSGPLQTAYRLIKEADLFMPTRSLIKNGTSYILPFRGNISLYINCEIISKQLTERRGPIDTNGDIAIARYLNYNETATIDLQWMVMSCDPTKPERETCHELAEPAYIREVGATVTIIPDYGRNCDRPCPRGFPGANGTNGLTGSPGERGFRGPDGNPGSPGHDGIPGLPGKLSPKGKQGDLGHQGPIGPRGFQGSPICFPWHSNGLFNFRKLLNRFTWITGLPRFIGCPWNRW